MTTSTTSQQTIVQPRRAYLYVVLVILAAAYAPIVIKEAQQAGIPSLYIIMTRLWLTSMVISPLVWRNHRPVMRQLTNRDWAWALTAGVVMAFSLALLFFSLEYTSVLINSVFRRTSPLWTLLLEMVVLGTAFQKKVWWGVLCALAGSLLVGFSGSAAGGGSNHLLGGALALINAFSIAAYLLIGRKLSGRLPALPYSWIVFTTAALVTLVMILISGTPLFGYTLYDWWLIFLIAFVAQFLGHLPINAALKYFTATYLNMAMQLSVLVAAVFAFFLLGEVPTFLQVIGSLIILVGVTLVSWKS